MIMVCLKDIKVANPSPITIIYVEPQTSWGKLSQIFTVDIWISDVVDLYGWEIKLGWNATILNSVSVLEGQFLKSGGSTFFTYRINNTLGYMVVDCTLLGNVFGVNGSGTLATVEFYVKAVGECLLDLYDSILINSAEQAIEYIAEDGYYYTSVHDVAIINLTASSTEVNVTVENQGTHTETFNVSVYYTRLFDPLIGTQTTTLDKGDIATLTFTWAPPSLGRYEIRAEANTLFEETDTADNIYTIIIQIGYSASSMGKQDANSLNGYYVAFGMLIFGLIMITPKAFHKYGKSQSRLLHFLKSEPSRAENFWQHLIINQLRNLH
jgi:hypothetical protein